MHGPSHTEFIISSKEPIIIESHTRTGGDNIFEMICIASDYPPIESSYRKPSPLFGLDLVKKYKIDIDQIFYVGDSISDLMTAKNLGCKAYGVENGGFDLKNDVKGIEELQYKICSDIFHAAQEIIKEC